MKTASSFSNKLQIASLESNSTWHNMKVHTLIQNAKQKQPSINAYLGARYSRSADSILDIAAEIMDKGADAPARLETIFQNYGHKSVGDMADLFVCIENIPMILAHKLFNVNPVIAGQERSTRYQNFKDPEFIKPNEELTKSKELAEEYQKIILKQMKDYSEMLEPTKSVLMDHFKPNTEDKQELGALQARAFDTARYFLPIGLQTSLAILMSARNWAELIGYLRGSNQKIENELAELLFELLVGNEELKKKGYIPEADGLIRHTESNHTRNKSTQEILNFLEKENLPCESEISGDMNKDFKVSTEFDSLKSIIEHYHLLNYPLSKGIDKEIDDEVLKELGNICFRNHNHHNQLGTIGQTGSILIDGFGDFGAILKDINRHRSLERFFPFSSNHLNIEEELNRENNRCYYLCDYLNIPELSELKDKYVSRFNETYSMIKRWKDKAKGKISEATRLEYTRYLLPHAHACRYRLYGSMDDWQYLIHLRIRNGGHIAYRHIVYSWLESLAEKSSFWEPMLEKLEPVDSGSREQFFDRS